MLVILVLLILAAAITFPFWGAAIMLAPALRAAARNEPWGDEYDEIDGLNDDGVDGAGLLALDAQTGDTVAIIHGELAEGETVAVCRMGGSAHETALVLHAKKGKGIVSQSHMAPPLAVQCASLFKAREEEV